MEIKRAFLLGNPRSGTSLLRMMLNNHSAIAAPPECGFLQWWQAKYADWDAADAKRPAAVEAFLDDLFDSRKIEGWSLGRAELRSAILTEEPAGYGELCALVYRFYAAPEKRSHLQLLVDKNNYYIHHLEEIAAAWPNAWYFWLVRDGRDVACSYRGIEKLKTDSPYKPKLPQDITAIAQQWRANNLRLRSFLERQAAGRYFRLRYEDLLTAPLEHLQPILKSLGLQAQPRMLEFYNHNDEPAATLAWKTKTLQGLDPSNIGKYKKILTAEEISSFERIAGDVLAEYNYL